MTTNPHTAAEIITEWEQMEEADAREANKAWANVGPGRIAPWTKDGIEWGPSDDTSILTLGQFRAMTAHLPDTTQVTLLGIESSADYWNVGGAVVPSGDPDTDDPPSVILIPADTLDSRQF